jgi:Protein of unknown function (DUF3102)
MTAPTDLALVEHANAIRALRSRIVSDVAEIGRRLIEVKKIVGHGNWLPWLDREFGWTDHTALNFMRVHEFVVGLSNSKTVSDLVLTLPVSSVYLLAAPSTPPEAQDEIIERAKAGETLPVAEVKQVIERHKGGPTHVCWQCRRRGEIGEVQQHHYAQYEDAEVWLHAACISAFDQAEQQRTKPSPESIRDDIGADNRAEAGRLRARVEELQADKRRLEIKIVGLESEIEELHEKLAATGTGGVMSSSEFQAAIKKWEDTVETQRGIIARLENENATLRAKGAALPDDDLARSRRAPR